MCILQHTEFLVKWKNYSAFDCTWEPEHHLSQALLDYFNKPRPSQELVQDHVDLLRSSMMSVLRGKAVIQHLTLIFRHDVYKYLFSSRGKDLVYGKWLLFDLEHLSKCRLPQDWYSVYDKHGDGSKAHFPIKMRFFLGKTPKTHCCDCTGNVKECNYMYIEKISVRFAKIPGTCVH